MTTSINKATVITDIWQNFYDRIKAQVKTVVITGSKTITVQNYVSSDPDQMLDSKSNYPIIVIKTPSLTTEQATMTRGKFVGTIDLEIYTNQGEAADKFLSSMIDSIETYKRDLRLVGIIDVELENTDDDSTTRDGIKIHVRNATFKIGYKYDKTRSF